MPLRRNGNAQILKRVIHFVNIEDATNFLKVVNMFVEGDTTHEG